MRILLYIFFMSMLTFTSRFVNGQVSIEELNRKIELQNDEINTLKNQVNSETYSLRKDINKYAPIGMVLFLFGGFCALWAQNTGRNPWLWFFFGLITNIIAISTLLIKNADYHLEKRLRNNMIK